MTETKRWHLVHNNLLACCCGDGLHNEKHVYNMATMVRLQNTDETERVAALEADLAHWKMEYENLVTVCDAAMSASGASTNHLIERIRSLAKDSADLALAREKAALADDLARAGRAFLGKPNEPFVINIKAADELEAALARYDALKGGDGGT